MATESHIQRAVTVRIYERGDEITILDPAGAIYRVAGDSAVLIREILDYLCEPRTTEALLAHLTELSGQSARTSPAVTAALETLRKAGVIVDEAKRPKATAADGPRVVVGLCGGIVAAHAPALAEILLRRGFRLRFAATESALRFVSELALSAMSHELVATSIFPKNELEPVPHIALARWADLVVVYPATATTLARIAGGDCSSAVSAIAITTKAPVLLVPAMNEAMMRSPSVRRNLAQLRSDGFAIAYPSFGYEVANSPGERRPAFGAAPPLQSVVDVVRDLLTNRRSTEA